MRRRDDFTRKTIEIMAKRVGCRCCNPEGRILPCGSAVSEESYVNIGVAVHIAAAVSGGKRYRAEMTMQERSSIDNGLWLCQDCAKVIDSNEKKYTAELLKGWKQSAELEARRAMYKDNEGNQRMEIDLLWN
ncbi:MAG: hypothetical protein K2I96_14200 [Lachnospiraceae bacterium]|nr:hypothetical protein [Lachnospiraceae bacterium]